MSTESTSAHCYSLSGIITASHRKVSK